MALRFLLFLAALVAFPLHAMANDLEGSWALRIDDATIFVFDIERGDGGEWHGSWTRPENFRSNGVVFSQMTGSEQLAAFAALERAETIELSFDDPRPGAVPDIFRFALVGPNRAQLTYVGTRFEPYPLVRVHRGSAIGPFDNTRIYDRDNAVVEAEYIELPDEGLAVPAPQEDMSAPIEETPDAPARERARIAADFLDGLTVAPDMTATVEPADDPEEVATAQAAREKIAAVDVLETQAPRSCSDFDRRNPPSQAVLEDRWGTDFEQIGSGLDIREYRMGNDDIARVTMLDDTVYINGCGPVD